MEIKSQILILLKRFYDKHPWISGLVISVQNANTGRID